VHHKGDAIARADAQSGKRAAAARGALLQLAERDLPIAVVDQNAVRLPARPPNDDNG